MLGAEMEMATSSSWHLEEYLSEKRDPFASPPTKRLKQAASPVKYIIIDDDNEETNKLITNKKHGQESPNESVCINLPSFPNNKQDSMNLEEIAKPDNKEDVLEITNHNKTPPFPSMDNFVEADSPVNCNNSGLVSSDHFEHTDNDAHLGSRNAKKGNGPLFKFLQPITPTDKTTDTNSDMAVQGNKDMVKSPCTPVNAKMSPDDLRSAGKGDMSTPASLSRTNSQMTTPRRKTPGRKLSVEEKLKREEEKLQKRKQKEALEQERKEKKEEKERMKEAKQKEKMEAKQKKEQERLVQLEQKKQREKDRQKKKEEEERAKQERLEKKEEERKKKEEEKKMKDDEKNSKMEEKRKKEEEEMSKKKKAQDSFASFFIKKEVNTIPKLNEQSQQEGKFQPFELKPFMTLANSPYRKPLSEDAKEKLSEFMSAQIKTTLYQVKKELLILRKIASQAREVVEREEQISIKHDDDDDDNDDVMIVEDDALLESTRENKTMMYNNKIRGKLLQFHDNYRPAYFGTWRKKSSCVGPRTPLAKDLDINYDVDSDEEWEEEEPGESLSNSEGEDEDDGGNHEDDEENDGFFVPHGYLSDDEVDGNDDDDDKNMEHDGHAQTEKLSQSDEKDKMQRHLLKEKTWEAEMKRQFKPMKPICIGCIWTGEVPGILKQLEACSLVSAPSIDPTHARKEHEAIRLPKPSNGNTATYCNTIMPVPEEAMPFLIKMIHGETSGLQKLVQTFRKRWTLKEQNKQSVCEENWESYCSVSKRQVEKMITTIATKELRATISKPRWYVHSTVLAKYNMENLALSTSGF